MSASYSNSKTKPTHFRWVVVALLFFICIVNYVDRAAISYAIPTMAKLFTLTPTEQGLVMGAFGIGYFVTTFFGGIIVDRYGSQKALLWASLLWSVAISLTGLANGFLMLYIARILLGFAEGPNFPAATRAITDWLPQKERALALSLALASVPLALALGGPLITQLMLHISWRGMFICLGILGLLWLPFWLLLFRNFPSQSKHVNLAEKIHITGNQTLDNQALLENRKHQQGTWKFLLTTPTLLANYWAFFIFGYFLFFFMTWLPSYLEDIYHLNLAQVGWFSVVPWVLAAILLWTTGYASDAIFKKTGKLRYARSYLIAGMQFISAISILPIIFIHDLKLALVFISLAVAFSMAANAPFYAVNADIAKARAGTALGLMDTTFAFAGFFAPAITGLVVQKTGTFTAAFILMSLLALSAVVVVLMFHRPDESKKLEDM